MKSPPIVEFPSGIPFNSGGFGSHIHTRESFPSLFLTDDWDLFFIERGRATWKLKNGDILDAPEGHFLLLPPFVAMWLQSSSSPCSQWFCHFSFLPIPKRVIFSVIRKDCMERGTPVMIPMVFSKDQAPELLKAYGELLSLSYQPEDPPWRVALALTRLVAELGAFALRLDFPAPPESALETIAVEDHRVTKLCRQIRENPSFPWKVSELAKSVKLSRTHLDRLWQSSMATTIKSYIVTSRLHHAAKLLNNPSSDCDSLKEISAAYGFSSQQDFCRQFKKIFGVAPSQYQCQPDMRIIQGIPE